MNKVFVCIGNEPMSTRQSAIATSTYECTTHSPHYIRGFLDFFIFVNDYPQESSKTLIQETVNSQKEILPACIDDKMAGRMSKKKYN